MQNQHPTDCPGGVCPMLPKNPPSRRPPTTTGPPSSRLDFYGHQQREVTQMQGVSTYSLAGDWSYKDPHTDRPVSHRIDNWGNLFHDGNRVGRCEVNPLFINVYYSNGGLLKGIIISKNEVLFPSAIDATSGVTYPVTNDMRFGFSWTRIQPQKRTYVSK